MPTASDIIKTAVNEIGVTEYPPRSNTVKYNTEYWGEVVSGDDEYPWCMAFVWWVFKHSGASDLFLGGGRTASCPTLARYAKAHNQWVTGDYKPGDVLIYNFDRSDEWDFEHTGILESISGDKYYAIEGNTSTSDDDNGGAVMRRTRYKSQIIGAYRPLYDEEQPKQEDEDMDVEKFAELWKAYRTTLQDNDSSRWSESAREWAVSNGIISGGQSDGEEFNGMWQDTMTREQMVTVLYRFYNWFSEGFGEWFGNWFSGCFAEWQEEHK